MMDLVPVIGGAALGFCISSILWAEFTKSILLQWQQSNEAWRETYIRLGQQQLQTDEQLEAEESEEENEQTK